MHKTDLSAHVGVIFADLLPPLTSAEFDALRADIEEHGVYSPILIDDDGAILDGHHRFKIDPQAPVRVVPGLSQAEKKAFVYRSNLERRNLSPDQRTEVMKGAKATAFELRSEDEKKWTQAAVAALLGVTQKTVSLWFTTNGHDIPGYNVSPDARVKVSPKAKVAAVAEVLGGGSVDQVAANLGVVPKTVRRFVQKEKKKAAEQRKHEELSSRVDSGVIHGDFREVGKAIADNSCTLIFTDPPYDRKSLPLFNSLGEFADRVLIDGGSLVTFCGQYVMDDVMRSLGEHLRYFWVCCCLHTGNTASMREYGIKVKWKPMLWFVKGEFRYDREVWVEDLVKSQQEKDHHPWQQSVLEANHFIKTLTRPGDLVCDPFCGGGTTALAAKDLKRKFWTCDVDARHVKVASGRLA